MNKSISCTLFDGVNLTNNVTVIIDEEKIISIEKSDINNSNYFMMPCLIDAHTHMININQVNQMISHGINTTFDVCAPTSLNQQMI